MSELQNELQKHKGQKSSIWRLLRQLLPYRREMILCALLVVLANAAELVKPAVLAFVIDDFLVGSVSSSRFYSLEFLGVCYGAVAVLGALFSYGQSLLVTDVCQKVLDTIRQDVFQCILHMPMETLDRFGSGRLITRATNDVETLSEFYSDVLVNLFRDGVLLAGIMGAMLWLSPRLALVSFAVLPLILLVTLSVRRSLRKNFMEMKRLIGKINAFFSENLSGMRVVQAFNRQKEKLREFDEQNDEYYRKTLFQILMHSFLRPAMEIINSMAISLLIWYGLSKIGIVDAAGTPVLEIGVLYAFTDYVKRFFEPINDLAEKYNTIQSALISSERIDTLLSDSEQESFEAGDYQAAMKGDIEFRNVWFAYKEEDWVLKNVSFHIRSGEKAAFVGATGAGKSTIIQLISRLYEPQKGEILIDGVPLRQWKLPALRRAIAVVLQDVFLFAGTIEDNVRFSAPETNALSVEDALRISLADSFVSQLPEGKNTRLGERAGTLSLGERQLLSFARAVMGNPAVLMLDEATASVDTETERRIQASLLRICQKRTAIFIAHRLSTIQSCDTIYVVSEGEIIEKGSHEELLALGGAYAALLKEKAV